MQFFPSESIDAYAATPTALASAAARDAAGRDDSSFSDFFADGLNGLSSFIDPERTDYCGLPVGFAAHVTESGTMGRERLESLKDALRRRDVSDLTLERLDRLSASGGPVSIGRIYGSLSGRSRTSDQLQDQERLDFLQLMHKLGCTADEADSILGLTDSGDIAAAWKKINARIGALDSVELHGSELTALARGLDLSDRAREQMLSLFKQDGETVFSRAQLENLLAGAATELAHKDAASREASLQLRGAINEALQAARLEELSRPGESIRQGRRAEHVTEVMQETIRKRVGFQTVDPSAPDEESAAVRAPRSLRADSEPDGALGDKTPGRERQASTSRPGETSGNQAGQAHVRETPVQPDGLERMLQRLHAENAPQGQPLSRDELATLARSHRQEIFSQVQQGLLQSSQNGTHRMTLQLTPEDLGQLTLILSVRQGEVRAIIQTERNESAAVLNEQLQTLRASLEEQGLKVAELEVQMQFRDEAQNPDWTGAREHNLMQEARERERTLRLARMRRDAATPDKSATVRADMVNDGRQGLHIVA